MLHIVIVEMHIHVLVMIKINLYNSKLCNYFLIKLIFHRQYNKDSLKEKESQCS